MTTLERFSGNPVLTPTGEHEWEASAAFNGCAIIDNGLFRIVYRAVSPPKNIRGATLNVSSVGYAESHDGVHFSNRRQLIKPEYDWEAFGCEDPRLTKLGDKYYVFYTALSHFPFDAGGIKIGVGITEDFQNFEKHPVTSFNSKAMTLFPEKINGQYAAVLSVNTDQPPAKIALALFDHEEDIWSPDYWREWYANLDDHVIPILRNSNDQVEVGAPPVKTEKGWLLVHSYIKNYRGGGERVFGTEAVLLDAENPQRVIGQTHEPLMVPSEEYERNGQVPTIVFPTGAIAHGTKLYIYYGAADTTCAVARVPIDDVFCELRPPGTPEGPTCACGTRRLERFSQNPIITPIPELTWEAKATFNPAAIYEGGRVHIVYRAMSEDNTSVFGYASSKDGLHVDERLNRPVYIPRENFEQKLTPGGNSGCEDPRLVRIDDTIYMHYTAFDGRNPPRVALTSISADDFLKHRWRWQKPVLISPPGYDDKDACLFPKKLNEQYLTLHRLGGNICLDWSDNPVITETRWLEGVTLFGPRHNRWDDVKVGIAAPPIETSEGWLLLYHGVSSPKNTYKLGATLLRFDNPTEIIARTDHPILEPELPYERNGQV
ncbi:MAG TPA: hypothetical protein VMC43_01600, partial [Candidatus Paceibacterota bacterium]|nr:hypothetical protein [Candidatus Paceibacterota bacterium]